MLNGIEILVERMKTHPEEFTNGGKWTEMLVKIDRHLTDEERQALKQGFSDAARETFNELVLRGIAGEDIEWDMVASLSRDYKTMMSYPMEKEKAEKEYYERQQASQIEQMKREMEMRRQQDLRYHAAAQQGGYGSGLLGNQARGIF